MASPPGHPGSVEDVAEAFAAHDYLADDDLSTVVYLSLTLQRPLLLEGEAGVGKTEVAKVLARWTGGELIRVQCYEGIDVAQAVYEWDHARQLVTLRAAEATGETKGRTAQQVAGQLYGEDMLLRRPLLRAISAPADTTPPVLLVDELDRADDEFEAFLLEVLSDYAVTVPELGTISAAVPPVVVITSNRTRDLHDALKRRCLYHWIDHPDQQREVQIVLLRAPDASASLARQVAAAVAAARQRRLYKPPGVAETIDWARALTALGVEELDAPVISRTLGAVLKHREDLQRVRADGVEALASAARQQRS